MMPVGINHTTGGTAMRRRAFFGTAAGAAVALAGAGAAPAGAAKRKRAVHRFVSGEWVRCRFVDIRANDVVWLEQVGVLRATSPAKRVGGGYQFAADIQIDPATNGWVPVFSPDESRPAV